MLTITQTLEIYKKLHKKKPMFGMDIYSKDFKIKDIVILGKNGFKRDAPPIRFNFYALVLCISGASHRNVNQYKYEVTTQSLQLIPPGSIHSFKEIPSSKEYYDYAILFEKKFLDFFDMQFHNNNIGNIDLDINSFSKVKELYEEIDLELKQNQESSIDYVKALMVQILIILKREKLKIKKIANNSRADIICNQFLSLIEDNFIDMRFVSDYASLIGISPKHLSETVKEKLGKNALFFIHKRIIKESQYLLSCSDLEISEISTRLNFFNSSQFSKFFKHHVGIPPKKYRFFYHRNS